MQQKIYVEFLENKVRKRSMTSIIRSILWENLNERNHGQNVRVYWKIILKWGLNK
jgi:hypothetical protein